MAFRSLIIYLHILFLLTTCSKDKEEIPPINEQLPIVMLHGLLASGDTYEKQTQRFTTNGYPQSMIFTFDWNTLSGNNNEQKLNNFIDEVLKKTATTKVYLIGHSAGSSLCYSYLQKKQQAAKISKYVHLAGFGGTVPNNEVPVLNIWSIQDKVSSGSNMNGAKNLKLTNRDHYEVATSTETFEAIYEFFLGNSPNTLSIEADENIILSGKSLSFGENILNENTTISIYDLNPSDGKRKSSTPLFSATVNNNGEWGPFTAQKETYYEFEVSGTRTVHYYRSPFIRSNHLVYLRSFPENGSLGATFLSGIPANNQQAVIAFFSANKAVIAYRDDLFINETELSIPRFTNPNQTTIALFTYDDNRNAKSDLYSAGIFGLFPFLSAVDMYHPSDSNLITSIRFNGQTINLPNLRSKTDGVQVAVFE